jgi:hypothetical protein
MPANLPLDLREEFLKPHMRGTAIELRNKQGTGWTQRPPTELLRITYPTADVQRALAGVSTGAEGRPLVFLGQRGRGKSHIMALLHHAVATPTEVGAWTVEWASKSGFESLKRVTLPSGFTAITETLSNQEYKTLWDLVFDRHPRGEYYRGKHSHSGILVPGKSLLEDMFAEKPTALILDEFQTWFDGLHDEPGDTGLKRRQWAFNFIQILSELAKERPDLLMLILSVRDTSTEGYRQIHRIGPIVIDFKGETAKEDRKRLLLHRLFENRAQFSQPAIEQNVATYAGERVRLLFPNLQGPEADRRRREVVESWPFSPDLLSLLEDHILMAETAQDKRDLIRILAELYRARGASVPLLTPSDFIVTNDECGVLTLLEAFATTVEQERLRDKAIRNLQALQAAGITSETATLAISGIWLRSMSASGTVGGTRQELQLDLTRGRAVDDNAFTAELASIVENSFNIHEVGTSEKRFCFKLEENPLSKVKANAKNDKLFEPDGPTAPGLLPVMKDQVFLRQVLEHQLRSPDSVNEPPTRVIILDPNWEASPWASVPASDQPERWDKPVLLVVPVAPTDPSAALGPWLARNVPTKRNMVRFLLPKAGLRSIFDDPDLRRLARCAFLAKAWKESESVYADIYRRFDKDLRRELADRFDRFALLHRWNFQQPALCQFHVEPCSAAAEKLAKVVEDAVRLEFFAPEDFQTFIVASAQRGETMKQVLAQLREPPAKPDVDTIPYLGEHAIYEEAMRVASRDHIAINVANTWYRADAGETADQAFVRLKRSCFRTGRELEEVQLGLPDQVGGGGVSIPVPPRPTVGPGGLFPPGGPTPPIGPVVDPPVGPTVIPPAIPPIGPLPPITPPVSPATVIRQSNGAKSGLNLLGDIERWGMPDAERLSSATLTLRGLSVKELRELCTKLPSKLLAELQITSNPDQANGNGGAGK